jgi:hypothetical protein
MAMPTRFEVRPEVAFPRGLMLVGRVEAARDWELSSREKFVQKIDVNKNTGEGTGLPIWLVPVTDLDPSLSARKKSFPVQILSKAEPKIPDSGSGMPPFVEVEGLTASAYVEDGASKDSKGRLAWSYRGTGVRTVAAGKTTAKEAA